LGGILVVEDERIVALDLVNTLGELGYTVAGTAARGEAAIEQAVALKPSIVLMDIRLAGAMDGIAAAAEINKHDDVPIIYLTAHFDDNTLQRASATRPFGYLIKPLRAGELRCAIEVALQRHEVESARSETEARYRDLYEHAPDMYLSTNIDGVITDCNLTLLRTVGYSKEELVGKSYSLLYSHEEALALRTAYETRAARGDSAGSHGGERRLRRRDGSFLDVSMDMEPILHASGHLDTYRVVFRDISVRKQADKDQRLLLQIGELQHSATDVSGVLINIAGTLATYLDASRCMFAEIDVEHQQVFIHRDAHPDVISVAGVVPLAAYSQENADDMQAGRPVVIENASIDSRTAAVFDDTYRPLRVGSSVSVPLLRHGTWIATLVVATSLPRVWLPREIALIEAVGQRAWLWVEHLRSLVTLREKEAQDTLRRAEERFRLFAESVKEYAIFTLDATGHVSGWNNGAERLLGYGAHEIVGRHFSAFYSANDVAMGHPADELLRAETEGRHEEEAWRVRKDGTQFWASVLITTVRDSTGRVLGFSKIMRDFSERRKAESELQEREVRLTASVKEREVLLQEVHHRVKNNLQVIASLMSMQMRQLTDAAPRAALGVCRARIEAIALIHEKLYQSKDYSSVPFSEYARMLVASIFHTIGISPDSVALELDISSVSLGVDKAIPCGLILNELISNALKHAFPSDRTGVVRVSVGTQDPDSVFIHVADDGVGLPPNFDPEKSRSLGMQLVGTLVEQLSGRLEISRHSGTAFRISFPIGEQI